VPTSNTMPGFSLPLRSAADNGWLARLQPKGFRSIGPTKRLRRHRSTKKASYRVSRSDGMVLGLKTPGNRRKWHGLGRPRGKPECLIDRKVERHYEMHEHRLALLQGRFEPPLYDRGLGGRAKFRGRRLVDP
jgi:hypothetical protein